VIKCGSFRGTRYMLGSVSSKCDIELDQNGPR